MTPPDRERRARETVDKMFEDWRTATAQLASKFDHFDSLRELETMALDAYAEAVRQAERATREAEIRALILSQPEVFMPKSLMPPDGRLIDATKLLTALAAPPETLNGKL